MIELLKTAQDNMKGALDEIKDKNDAKMLSFALKKWEIALHKIAVVSMLTLTLTLLILTLTTLAQT